MSPDDRALNAADFELELRTELLLPRDLDHAPHEHSQAHDHDDREDVQAPLTQRPEPDQRLVTEPHHIPPFSNVSEHATRFLATLPYHTTNVL